MPIVGVGLGDMEVLESSEYNLYGIPKDTIVQCSSLAFVMGLEPSNNPNHAIIWEALNLQSKPALQTLINFKLTNINDFSLPPMKTKRQSYEWYTPKGVLKSNWMAKYLHHIPALVAIFYTLDWSDSNWLNKKNELANIVSSVKAIIGERHCRVAVILLQNAAGSPATDSSSPYAPNSETETNASLSGERASILCESCDLPTKHLFVLPLSDAQLIPGYTARLEAALSEIAGGFYLSESKTVRNHRDFLNKTNHQLLFVRHCFKTGFLLEMKNDLQAAIKAYQQSYQHLSELRFTDTNLHEIRISSAIINYKVCRVNFLLNLPRDAIAQFRRHIDLFRPRMGPKSLIFEHYAWLASQYELFGWLFESAVQQGLPAVQTQHPGFYYQQAAQFASLRRTTALHLCSAATDQHNHMLDGIDSLEIYGQRPWRAGKHSLEPPEPEREACGVEAIQYHELTKVRHHEMIIPLYSRAMAQFQRYRCPRIKQQLMVQMATEYQKAKQYQKALAVVQHVLGQYRSERWWALVSSCALLALQCASAVADVPAYVAAALEIASPRVTLAPSLKIQVFRDGLMRVLKGEVPAAPPASTADATTSALAWTEALQGSAAAVEIDMSALVPCVEVRASFSSPSCTAYCPSSLQLHVRNNFLELIRVRDFTVVLEPHANSKVQPEHEAAAAEKQMLLRKESYVDLPSGEVQKLDFPFTLEPLVSPYDGFKIASVSCCLDGSADGSPWRGGGAAVRLSWPGAGAAAAASHTPHHSEFLVLKNPSFDTLSPKTFIKVEKPEPLIDVEVKYDKQALVWEWLVVDVLVTCCEPRPLTDVRLSLSLQRSAQAALEATTRVSSCSSAAPSDSCGAAVQNIALADELQPGQQLRHKLLVRSLTAATRHFSLILKCGKSVEVAAEQWVQCPAVHCTALAVTAAVPFVVELSCESLQYPAMQQQHLQPQTTSATTTVRLQQPFLINARVSCSSHVPVTLHSSKLMLSSGVESYGEGSSSCSGCISACSLSSGEAASDCFCLQVAACSAPQLQLGHFLLHWSRRGDGGDDEPRTVTMSVALPTVNVTSESLLVEGSVAPHCSLHAPAALRYCITNHSLHCVECVVSIEQSQCFMLAGNQEMRIRLLSQQEEALQYLLYPLSCGTLPLPRLSVVVENKPAAGRQQTPVAVAFSKSLPSHLLVKPL